MAEDFHTWVRNLPWYERLFYEIWDPNKISCTGVPESLVLMRRLSFVVGVIGVLSLVLVLILLYHNHRGVSANDP